MPHHLRLWRIRINECFPPSIPSEYEATPKFHKMHTHPTCYNTATAIDYRLFRLLPRIRLASVTEKSLPDSFISALAHEVRNPLSNINLSISMLEAAIKDDDLKIYLDIIRRSSTRINNQITELLKYQLADEAPAVKHSIEQLLDEVIVLSEDRIALKHVVIRKNYGIPDCKIAVQGLKIKIALTNIIINAIDAMPLEKGQLTLATQSIGGRYALQIEDNGCGISKSNLKSIFKPYFSSKPGGLGIGLAATYDILRSNHVRVEVESKEGKGTRFTLIFDQRIQPL